MVVPVGTTGVNGLKLCLKSILSHSESFETHLFLGENWVGTSPFRMSWNQDFQSILGKVNVQEEDLTLKRKFLLENRPRQPL